MFCLSQAFPTEKSQNNPDFVWLFLNSNKSHRHWKKARIAKSGFKSQIDSPAMNQPKYGQIIDCGLAILIVSLLSLCRLRNTSQLTCDTADQSKWPVFLQNASGNPSWKQLVLRHIVMVMFNKFYHHMKFIRYHITINNHLRV